MELKPMYLPIEIVLNVITQCLPKYANVILGPSHPITQTLLSFTLVCRETYRLASRYLREHCVYLSTESSLRSFVSQLSNKPDAPKVASMLFVTFWQPSVPSKFSATQPLVLELLSYTAPYLRRLIIDGDVATNRLLEGLRGLENLEELVHTSAAGYLDKVLPAQVPVWKSWRKLKRLALCNIDADLEFWEDIAEMPQLETLVLTRADQFTAYNIKVAYFHRTSRPLKLLVVDVERDQVRFGNMRRMGWNAVDPEKKMTIMTYNVPMLYSDEDPGEACQAYVRSGAENGTLWDWEGEVMQHLLPASTPLNEE